MPKIRIYGEISQRHEADFLLLKGFFGCKNNGDTLEKLIDRTIPTIKKEFGNKNIKG